MSDRIPNLTIEHYDDGSFLLWQDSGGNLAQIELHESQVRHIAVMAGLVPTAASAFMPAAWVLARRLRVLCERINELDDRLRLVAAGGHAMLDEEQAFSLATWELATEFCADLIAHEGAGASYPSQKCTPSMRAAVAGNAGSAQVDPEALAGSAVSRAAVSKPLSNP